MDHLRCSMNRQMVRSGARPRRNIGCHRARQVGRLIGCAGEKRDDQVFERDHANLQLHQFSIRQINLFCTSADFALFEA